jgi:hypothetical protein
MTYIKYLSKTQSITKDAREYIHKCEDYKMRIYKKRTQQRKKYFITSNSFNLLAHNISSNNFNNHLSSTTLDEPTLVQAPSCSKVYTLYTLPLRDSQLLPIPTSTLDCTSLCCSLHSLHILSLLAQPIIVLSSLVAPPPTVYHHGCTTSSPTTSSPTTTSSSFRFDTCSGLQHCIGL